MNRRSLRIIAGVGIAALALSVLTPLFSRSDADMSVHVGVLVPVEHPAMDEIILGLKEVVHARPDHRVRLDIQNAQGDANLQRAILEKFARQGHQVVVAIGTDISLLAQHRLPQTPLVALDVTEQVKQSPSSPVTGVLEASIEPSYRFIRKLLPTAKKVAMVYSASDKNSRMVEAFGRLAKQDNVQVQAILVQSMADLYVLAQSIDRDAEAVFIAKDHMIASGAPILARAAAQLGIPFISSDEGSVTAGATIALGNRERDIGRQGGRSLLDILDGRAPQAIPSAATEALTLFINEPAASRAGLQQTTLAQIAVEMGASVQVIHEVKS